MIKTVDIVGSEVKVEDLGGQNAAVKNLGSGSIYVSTKPNITAGADNVIEIPAGAGEVVLDANGTVYIVGTGKVQCTGTPYAVPNFKLPSTSSGGGGGTSDVTKEYVDAQDTTNLNLAKAYTDNAKSEIQTTIDTVNDTLNTHIADQVKHITAEERTAWNAKADTDTATTTADGLMSAADKEKLDGIYSTLNTHIADQVKHITAEERTAWNSKAELTDIPTELPANGGNADTVDGLHANEIASNPNLLINPDFKINQRGKSEYSDKTQYTVDHWLLSYSGSGNTFSFNVKTCQLVSGTKDTDGYHANLQQEIENPMQYIGKNLTLSCKMSNLSKTALIQVWRYEGDTISSIKATNYDLNEFKSLTFQIPDDITSDTKIRVILQTRGECNLNWAKLELGTIATPFVPPDPATELLKCQRYYQIRSANNISSVDLRPNMRLSSPTITALSDGNYSYDAEL